MTKILYCDRCGKQITSGKNDFKGFDVEFRSFGGHYPQLCPDCEEKFKKVIKDFLNEGKKEQKQETQEKAKEKKKFGLF